MSKGATVDYSDAEDWIIVCGEWITDLGERGAWWEECRKETKKFLKNGTTKEEMLKEIEDVRQGEGGPGWTIDELNTLEKIVKEESKKSESITDGLVF